MPSPISISSTAIVRAFVHKPNYLSPPVATQSYFFASDIIYQSTNEQAPPGWSSGPVNGQDLDYGMDPQIVNANPQAVKNSLTSLPTMSLVTNINSLLNPDRGIYVNAANKGRAWERPKF